MKKWFIFALLAFISVLLHSCFMFRKNDRTLARSMAKDTISYKIDYFSSEGKKMRYLYYEHNDSLKPLMVFIHGAPGSSSSFLPYIKNTTLRENYSILIVDRLGYGFSEYGKYHTISTQSAMITALISSISKDNQDVFLAGHSFGGSIVGYITIQRPTWLKASIMLAPALDPNNERYFWFGKLGVYKSSRWMISKALRVSADEKYNHENELRSFENEWGKIQTPILHIHGDKDKIVPFVNLAFSQKHISPTYLSVDIWQGDNHYIPFTKRDKVVETIIRYCQTLH